jgi:anti-sigma factor RsiW
MKTCEQIHSSDLAAWMDGEMTSDAEQQAIAAHVSVCPRCAARIAELRAYKARMAQFGESTTPIALPSGLWESVRAALDRADAERLSTGVHRKHPVVRLRPALAAGVFALLLTVVFAFVLPVIRPHPVVPLEWLTAPPAADDGVKSEATADADAASRWLSARLRMDIPPVPLTLVGARMEGVEYHPPRRVGVLKYRSAQNVPIELYVSARARVDTSSLRSTRHNGQTYFTGERNGFSSAVWETDGRTFVATAPMPLDALLRYAHEMSRRCSRN